MQIDIDRYYSNEDVHRVYYGEIIDILEKEEK